MTMSRPDDRDPPPDLALDRRVAVATPPANPTVEPELHHLLSPSVTLYTTRLPVLPQEDLGGRNRGYVEHYPDLYANFGPLRPSALLIALTGPSYRGTPAEDEHRAATLSRDAGVPVLPVSLAIAEALRRLSARRINLVSPYPAWLTELAVAYWQASGFEVADVVKTTGPFRAYHMTTGEVSALLDSVPFDRADATVMSGTGMITLPAIGAVRRRVTHPVLSSNLCGAWWLLRQAGVTRAPTAFEAVSPELARTV